MRQVPDKVLYQRSKQAISILFEIAVSGDFNLAQKVVVEWFLVDPNGAANAITDFEFNVCRKRPEIYSSFEKLEDSIAGVRFKKDNNEPELKLLVENPKVNHPYFLNKNSPLGKLFSELKPGEVKSSGLINYELIEHLPAYVFLR